MTSFLGIIGSFVEITDCGSSFFCSTIGSGFACGCTFGRTIEACCFCCAGATGAALGCSAAGGVTLVFFFVCCLIATMLIQREVVYYYFLYNFHQSFEQCLTH